MIEHEGSERIPPAERLRYLECMDRVSWAIYQSEDPEVAIQQIMSHLLETFQVDRAGLLFPLDHDAEYCTVPYEATAPEFPGAGALGVKLPVDEDMHSIFRRLLSCGEPDVLGLRACEAWPTAAEFGVKSLLCMTLRPRDDRPWALLLHQCTRERTWTDEEVGLFRDIGRRLTEALTHLFLIRKLRALAKAVEEAEARFETAADSARIGLVLTAQRDRLVFANRALCELVRCSPEELLALTIDDLVQGGEAAEVRALLEQGVDGAVLPAPFETLLAAKDGPPLPVEVSATVMAWRGEIAVLLGFTDLRAQQELEQERAALVERAQAAHAEVERLSQAKDLFMAVFSHELRNLLTTILTWSDMLQLGKIPPDQQSLAFRRINQAAKSLTFQLNDLADFSRAILGKLELTREPTSIHRLVQECVADVEPLAAQKSVAIRVDVAAALPALPLDRERTRQVLVNLLSNALKFTPAGGRVDVCAGPVPDQPTVELSVTDTGIGIAPEFLPRVFDVFAQEARVPGDRGSAGLGLGMAICKRLVELQGGRITVESPGVDQGTTFRVRLPV